MIIKTTHRHTFVHVNGQCPVKNWILKKNLGQKTTIECVSVIIQVSERNTC